MDGLTVERLVTIISFSPITYFYRTLVGGENWTFHQLVSFCQSDLYFFVKSQIMSCQLSKSCDIFKASQCYILCGMQNVVCVYF